ncbi:MAG: peptidylprolyl isomerase [bacterium]|nr:peptidylprolyl isomerase [bacterium]
MICSLLLTVGTVAVADDGGQETNPALLDPAKAVETAPDSFRVLVATTAGDFTIEVTREWAPHGVDRFYNLVKVGYYDDTAFFRVIQSPRPFMAQIGLHGNPKVTAAWQAAAIPDDPIVAPNTRGAVTFAMRGQANSRTTQFFINFADNSYLSEHGKFAPFGRIVEGMDVVDSLYSGYGECGPRGNGPRQDLLTAQGNTYLKEHFPELDYIKTARIVAE